MHAFGFRHSGIAAAAIAAVALCSGAASAQSFSYADPSASGGAPFRNVVRGGEPASVDRDEAALPARLRRQVVDYPTREGAGTIVIDTAHTYLYFVLGNGKAIRYGIGVGREGFTWAGVQKVSRKAEWPDWTPPAEMIARQPYLPRFVAGGPGNPLGARAMYLGATVYRIHGTNQPDSIGKRVSSGCIRMLNEDVIDLYKRTDIGTKVVVLPAAGRHPAQVARSRTRSTPAPVQRTRTAGRPLQIN